MGASGTGMMIRPAAMAAPRSNQDYWLPKLARNRERDAASMAALRASGWDVLVIWECEMRDMAALQSRLQIFLGFTTRGKREGFTPTPL